MSTNLSVLDLNRRREGVRIRRIAAAIVSLVAVSGACGQPLVFTPQAPFPTGRSLGGVAFNSPTHGFLVGQNHTLIETNDGGATWIKRMQTDLSTDPFYTITFASPTRGYIAGNNQDAYRTTDGGATWNQMTGMQFGSVRELDFISPTVGFAGYNGAITKTSDGGTSWPLRSGYPDSPIVFGMDFRDEQVGLAGGIRSTPHHDEAIYRTEDGGATWSVVHDQPTNDVMWLDQTTAIAIIGDTIYRSTDEGRTWGPYSFGVLTGLGDMARAGSSSVICGVSLKGDIWQSTNLGASWVQKVEGIGTLPADWAISFSDENNGWVVGDRGLTYKTTDAGESWTLISSGCGDEITDLEMFNEEIGYAVTYFGYLFRTRNAGAFWDVKQLKVTGQVFGRGEGLNAVSAVDEWFAVTGGQGGILFRTYDGGDFWESVGYPTLPGTFDVNGIKMVSRDVGYIAGNGNGDENVWKTTSGGSFWTPLANTPAFYAAIDARGEMVWALSGGTVVDRSLDGGNTFERIELPGDVNYCSDIEFADASVGWIAGWYGYVARSTDGGATWTQQVQPQDEIFLDLKVVSPSEAWLIGRDGNYRYFYKRTTNGGATWTRTEIPLAYAESMSGIHVNRSGRVWLTGAGGKILASQRPPLTITLPGDVPAVVAAGRPADIAVSIVAGGEQIAQGSPTLWVRTTGTGPFTPLPITYVQGDEYKATLPAMACTDTPQFYFSARGDAGSEVRLPATAPTAFYTTRMGEFRQVAILDENFDSGIPSSWIRTGLWHASASCAPAGACGSGQRAYYGQDSTCTFDTGARTLGSLISPSITLPQLQPGQRITLSFCHALRTQNGEGALSDYDKAIVWVRTSPFDFPVEWCVDRSSSRELRFDISQAAGKAVRIEFNFDSDNALQNAFRGWHVDNVRIEAPVVVCENPCRADFDRNGQVDFFDYLDFVQAFGADEASADIDGNGQIDFFDYLEFAAAFSAGC
jgi:photosystem II stability/assembly factor-like uncharacterized protein